METDADRDTPSDTWADVCIVGAGPVGLSLASALDDRGCACVVVESGRRVPEDGLAALNREAPRGAAHEDLSQTRRRGVGGTARAWNTEHGGHRVAKLVGLDSIDFEPRSWVPWSGWPIGPAALSQYVRPAMDLLVGMPGGPLETPQHRLPIGGASGLVERHYLFASPDPVTSALPSKIVDSPTTCLILGATVTSLLPGRSGESVRGVQWRTLQGRTGVVRADVVVLAAGGIENARMLLAADTLHADIRRGDGWLGRGFMEHPVDASLTVQLPGSENALPYELPSGHVVMPRIGLAERVQRKEELVNASIRLIPGRLGRRIRWLGRARRLLRRYVGPSAPRTARVLIDLEQGPHRDNRISLSQESDPLGFPRISLDWSWRPEDEARRRSVVDVVARELERAGLGPVHRLAGSPLATSSHHHPGATRMSADSRLGVVDEDLRVHQTHNLYAVGSSVFPTAGFANPTLTAVALALRLADHLSRSPGGRT